MNHIRIFRGLMGIHRMLSRRRFQIRYTKFTITKAAQQACIERNNATDGQIFVFDSKYSTGSVDFPTVTLTYTTGDATATLPVAGTGLASLGVALATVLRKRK